MILSAPGTLLLATLVAATTEPAPSPLEPYRTAFEVLTERMIGTVAQPVRFDWRNVTTEVGVVAGQVLELNSFQSKRLGIEVRVPMAGLLGHVALQRVWSSGTPSTDLLALTPYRQTGRPTRFELLLGVALPVAEGVVTAWPSFVPATQMALSVTAELRYLFYPGALGGASFTEAAKAALAPRLTERELTQLDSRRVPGMRLDSARYALLMGLSLDVYLHQGFYVSPRIGLALPVWGGMTDSDLGCWWDLGMGAGYAF
ncbi:MAG TPA: hypothetical protein VFH51_06490 [Myxococcota bacterium]|nr:hypothetical protein [Myxococcota bacterium]